MRKTPAARRPTLASAIIWQFVLYATLPVVIGGCVIILLYMRKNINSVRTENRIRVLAVVQPIKNSLREQSLILQSLTHSICDTTLLPSSRLGPLLEKTIHVDTLFTAMYLFDTTGILLASGTMNENGLRADGTGGNGHPVASELFRRLARSDEKKHLKPALLSGGRNTVLVHTRCRNRILIGIYSLRSLFERIDSIGIQGGYGAIIIDENRTVIHSTDHDSAIGDFGDKFKDLMAPVATGKDTTFNFTIGDQEFIGSALSVKPVNWTVVVARNIADAYAPIWQLTSFFLILLLVLGGISAGGGLFLSRWLSRLFAYLSHNARRIAQGDYNAPMPDQYHRELEAFAENIRRMVTAIGEREEQYRELNQETKRNLLFQRTLLEAINVPVVYYNLHGDILGCNSLFETAMGVSRDEILHYTNLRKAPEPLQQLMGELVSISGTGARAFERTIMFADEREHTLIIHRAPYYLEEGSIAGYICALLDITEHRLTEDAFQRLIQSTVGVHGVDFFHRIVRLLCKWIGCDGALIGEVPDGDKCSVLSMLLNGMRVDEYIFPIENSPAKKTIEEGFLSIEDNVCTIYPDDEELRRLAIRGYAAVPLEAEDGTILGILALFSRSPLILPLMARASMEILAAIAASEILRMRADRERVKLEARLRQMEKMDAIGQLAGGIAHDINNQLGCILGYTEVISETNVNPELSGHLDKIINSVSRTHDLVKKLLAFSRHGNFVMKPVNITTVIHEVVGLLQHSVDKSIALSMVAADGQLYVMGDPGQLQNAMLNLGLNARDAMPDGGTITYEVNSLIVQSEDQSVVPACLPGEYVCITVRDNGVGMSGEIASRIYEPFFTTKEEGKGTGLGLSAVYGTIRSHRGGIDVKSEIGKGTVFTVLLPRYTTPVSDDQGKEEKPAIVGSGTILVIDDEIDIRDTVTITLRKCGYTVITAGDGLEGVQLFIKYSGRIDLVILDMVLPGIDGKTTFERLKEIDSTVKVIVVSGYSVDGRIQSLLDNGARSFLQKPFRGVDLLRMVTEIMKD